MQFTEIETGRNYGPRQNPQGGSPFFRVKVTEKIPRKGGNQLKVRHLDDPHKGLEEYLKPFQIVALWKDVRPITRDEERLARLYESIASVPDKTVERAVETVFEATGDVDVWCRPNGAVECEPEALQRVAARADLQVPVAALDRAAFVDRRGTLHLPFAAVEQLARAFAAAEPGTISLYIDGCEEASVARASAPSAQFYRESYVGEEKPGWELARQWAGSRSEVDALERENRRLRNVVQLGVRLLLEENADPKAAELQREFYGS